VFALVDLAAQYGPIYRLTLRGNEMVVVSTQALVDELCDERRPSGRHSACPAP
jgi:cytochrome P450/NADPH-cytochrome P450 reductase